MTGASDLAQPGSGGGEECRLVVRGGEPRAEAGYGEQGLEAADAPARTVVAVVVDRDVADLAGRGAVAVEEHALEDEPGTDTEADAQDQEAAVGGAAVGVLGQRGDVGVVGDVHRDAGGASDLAGQVGAVPAEVGGVEHGAAVVDDARRADADAEDRPVAAVDQGAGELDRPARPRPPRGRRRRAARRGARPRRRGS